MDSNSFIEECDDTGSSSDYEPDSSVDVEQLPLATVKTRHSGKGKERITYREYFGNIEGKSKKKGSKKRKKKQEKKAAAGLSDLDAMIEEARDTLYASNESLYKEDQSLVPVSSANLAASQLHKSPWSQLHDSNTQPVTHNVIKEPCTARSSSAPPRMNTTPMSPVSSHGSEVVSHSEEVTAIAPELAEVEFEDKASLEENLKRKMHCCCYCKKLVKRLGEHLRAKHKDEPEVLEIINLPKTKVGVKQLARNMFLTIQRKGDFLYNKCMLEKGLKSKEHLIVKYQTKTRHRKNEKEGDREYVACPNCLTLMNKETLWRHEKECIKRHPIVPNATIQGVKAGRQLTQVILSTDKRTLDLINHMIESEEKNIIRMDSLLLRIIEFELKKIRGEGEHTRKNVSARVKYLARLLKTCKEEDSNIQQLSDLLVPEKGRFVLDCIEKLCTDEAGNYRAPSTVEKYRTYLAMAVNRFTSVCIEEHDYERRKLATDFLTYINNEYIALSRPARLQLHVSKFNKSKVLPIFTDIEKVHKSINLNIERLKRQVNEGLKGKHIYIDLVRYCLCQLMLFNRKRAGEMQRIELDMYLKGLQENKIFDSAVLESLDPFEVHLAKSIKRIEFMGKRNRKIPLLLTSAMVENIDVVLQLREIHVIKRTDGKPEILFARPGDCRTAYQGHCLLKEVALEANISNIEAFKSTSLRKHMGTMAQVLELPENQQDMLASFMGHDIRVHRDFYRLPMDVMERCKVAQVLLAVNSGVPIERFQDKLEGGFEAFPPAEEQVLDVQGIVEKLRYQF